MAREYDKYADIDKQVVESDEVMNTEIRINPDFYIHLAMIKAQKALESENIKEGFLKYRIFINYIERICKASGKVTDDYHNGLVEFKKSEEFRMAADDIKQHLLADKKMELIMEQVFNEKELKGALKM